MKFFTEIRATMSSAINKQKLNWEKRSLEGRLNQLVDIMNGHKEASLPTGHKFYKMIWENAQQAIGDYRTKAEAVGNEVTYEEVTLGVPALREMEALAAGVESKSALAQTITTSIIATCVVGALSSVFFAAWHDVYLLLTQPVTHWLIR